MWLLVLNVVFVLIYIYGSNGTVFNKYTITQGGPGVHVVRCIARSMNGQHEALRIRDWDGECTILSETWMSNKIYHAGYTYVEKQMTQPGIFESFTLENPIGEPNPEDVDRERVWTLPGTFNKGGTMQIYIYTGSQDSWNSFQFRLSNLTNVPFVSSTGVPLGLLLFSITANKVKDEIRFKTYDETQSWDSSPTVTPLPMDFERTHELTVNARDQDFQILLDGVEVSVLPYVAPPEEGKTLLIRKGTNKQMPTITNITIT